MWLLPVQYVHSSGLKLARKTNKTKTLDKFIFGTVHYNLLQCELGNAGIE